CKGASAVGPTPAHKDGSVICVSWGAPGRVSKLDIKTEKTSFIDLGTAPYTYSDFTGYALLGALAPIGSPVQPFGCSAAGTLYSSVTVDFGYVGTGTYSVYARVADDATAIKTAPWVLLFKNPDVTKKLDPPWSGAFFEVKVTMEGSSPD